MVLVDTSIWVEASRREGDLAYKVGLENLLDAYEACLCSPVRLEFLGGSHRDERKKLGFWLDCIPYRSATEAHWQQAIRNAWRLRDKGHTLPWNDILIATIALDLDMRVYARDGHFKLMAQMIGLRLYEPGYGGRYAPED